MIMKHFHIHAYFKPESLEAARLLNTQISESGLFSFVKMVEKPIGPHPTGMIEAHFGEAIYDNVVEWIDARRGVMSVLVHEDTDDDVRDHTEGIRWLGEPVKLDFDFFELIKTNPAMRIHPLKA